MEQQSPFKDNDLKGEENAPAADKQTKGESNKSEHDTSTQIASLLSPVNWASEYALSDDEVNEIANPEWIYENLIISGHIVTIPAEPNGGKTTVMMYVAGQMARAGYEVFYVNVDTSGGDAKPMVEFAKKNGFTMMLPDMKNGKSITDFSNKLMNMATSDERFEKTVFIFDTLKKFADIISKRDAKRVYQMLRGLSARDVTSILLAHTNKYNDKEGKPIYEGTGDIRSDTDELIYFIPQKHGDGSMTITTKPDKVRGSFNPISFHIGEDRQVTQLNDVVDTTSANEIVAKKADDQPTIDIIINALNSKCTTQQDILEYCKKHDGLGQRTIKRVLKDYARHPEDSIFDDKFLWAVKSGKRNSHVYSLIDPEL